MKELEKSYNPKDVEGRIYDFWLANNLFAPKVDKTKKPFVITIPPPNVTGSLHMGHCLNNTIQDILIRRKRMEQIPTLWVPGTDHAGIATQNVVEKQLKKQNIRRHDLGREKFIEKVWQWKKEYGSIITGQLKQMGCSCDWSRERFTMDDDYAKLVSKAFIHYYKKGYIYQGKRVVSWCPRCQTSLSDLEIEYNEQKGKLYYFRYDKNFPITIATTRPETKLGDVAVAVNPKDKRYKKYIGKTFDVNFVGKELKIKVISDPEIDMNFGTGAVGVTPAHSLIDAELGRKYNLPSVEVIDKYGKMTDQAGEYAGLKAKEAGQKIAELLEKVGLLEKTEEINNKISVCYRCGSAIEPIPSLQWFLKMDKLSIPAIKAVASGEVKFYPEKWEKVYLDWMKNIRDWCISRQIWWGHRLPVWKSQTEENSKLYVGENPPKGYKQVDDVLDTWFSSALWPFAVFNKKQDLEYFYPTSVLSTARDILNLWVSRMIFSGIEFTGKNPFSKVYIHPTVFNKEGKRMSKSLGTGVDPLLLMDKYGTDATRFGLISQNTGTQDIKFSEDSILAAKKFANKLWNASRFTLSRIDTNKITTNGHELKPKTEADKEILSKLDQLTKLVNKNLDEFRFGQSAEAIYHFFWHEFCDKYIEEAKKQMGEPSAISSQQSENTQNILLYVLSKSLILLHPFMPFITEEIYQKLPIQNRKKSIMIEVWPK